VRHEKNHIELAHISRQQIEFFSKRSTGIMTELSARGTSRDQAPHALRQGINLAHRQAKAQDMSRDQLHQTWKEAAATIGIQFGRTWTDRATGPAAARSGSIIPTGGPGIVDLGHFTSG
jgi:hypothetical protein